MLLTCRTSGTSGSNGARSASIPLIESAPIVVPWYAMLRAIALYFFCGELPPPGMRVPGSTPTFHAPPSRTAKYCRASFHAASTASEPPETKKTRLRSPGASDAISAASSIARGCAYVQFV